MSISSIKSISSIQKPNWKLFLTDPLPEPGAFFAAFNSWIPQSPEVFIDVADYKHVSDGPLILLVGHYNDYAFDHTGRRHGFLYSRKRELQGTSEQIIKSTLKETILAALRLQKTPPLEGKIHYKPDELLFVINDRAVFPNTKDTFSKVKPELEKILNTGVGSNSFNLIHAENPNDRLTIHIRFSKPLNWESLAANLK